MVQEVKIAKTFYIYNSKHYDLHRFLGHNKNKKKGKLKQ